jgi:hypothetical protein
LIHNGSGESGLLLWLATSDGELLDNPAQTNPVYWTIKAKIALQGWIRMKDELADEV